MKVAGEDCGRGLWGLRGLRARVAREECEGCEGTGNLAVFELDPAQCGGCYGEGGKWHEYIQALRDHLMLPTFLETVTHTSILIREHEVCGECDGERTQYDHIDRFYEEDSPKIRVHDCGHCQDADGNPTGAEPGTATGWGVK